MSDEQMKQEIRDKIDAVHRAWEEVDTSTPSGAAAHAELLRILDDLLRRLREVGGER